MYGRMKAHLQKSILACAQGAARMTAVTIRNDDIRFMVVSLLSNTFSDYKSHLLSHFFSKHHPRRVLRSRLGIV